MIAERNNSGRFCPWTNEDMKAWAEEEFRLLLPLVLDALREILRDPRMPAKIRKEAAEMVLERVYGRNAGQSLKPVEESNRAVGSFQGRAVMLEMI